MFILLILDIQLLFKESRDERSKEKINLTARLTLDQCDA